MNFDAFWERAQQATPVETLDELAETLETTGQYSAWFEALKLKARWEVGAQPWNLGQAEELTADQQQALEERLVAACRRVGEKLIGLGRITEGWMYLRPIGDATHVERLLKTVPLNDDTVEQLIEVTLGHGVAPAWGFQLLLERMGTCNAITAFDSQMVTAPLLQRHNAAERLVRHLYQELWSSVEQHWRRQLETEGAPVNEAPQCLAEAIEKHPELLANQNYHIDTYHLSSVVRIGRISDDPEVQQLARQLCVYGRGLGDLYQPRGYAVFEPYYVAHGHYYDLLLEPENHPEAWEFFRQRRQVLTEESQQPTALTLEGQIEATDVLVELLTRCGRIPEAIDVLLDQLFTCGEHQRHRWTMLLFQCCQTQKDFEPLMDYSKKANDAFGFGLGAFYQRFQSQLAAGK